MNEYDKPNLADIVLYFLLTVARTYKKNGINQGLCTSEEVWKER